MMEKEREGIRIRRLNRNDESIVRMATYHAIHIPDGQTAFPVSIVDEEAQVRLFWDGFGREAADLGFVVEADGETIGAAWVRLLNGEPRGYGNIDDHTPELGIAVWPEHRGKGWGTQLMEQLVGALKKESVKRISLSVHHGNRAKRLYERCGFQTFRVQEEDDIMVLQMTCDEHR